ncbi:MAG: carboxymuconolactone decarboxylase family protein [Planctomycetota bacterium]
MAAQLVWDHRTAELDEADRALCDYAVRLTLTPGAMGRADVDRLRAHGFGDEAITIATQVIGYFNYINRIADGLGVDDEAGMTPPRDEWRRGKGRDYLPGETTC